MFALQRQRGAYTVEAISSPLSAWAAVLLKYVRRTLSCISGALFRQIAFISGFPAHDPFFLQLTILATGPRGALRFLGQLASDRIAARIHLVAVVDAAAIAILALLYYAVTASSSYLEIVHYYAG